MNEITFVPLAAGPEHLDVVASWLGSQWPEYFAEHDVHEHLRAEMNLDTLPIAFVALARGTAVGTVALRASSIRSHQDLGPWIGGLYVHPEIRGVGLGAGLVRAAVSTAFNMGHEAIYVGSDLRAFFENLGFDHVDDVEQDGQSLAVLKFERPPSLYDKVGGEEGVNRLVQRFYDLMDERTDATTVRGLHAKSLKSSREKLFKFLSGWTGGPQIYIEQYGHPRLRARHLPFAIGRNARDEWMLCMDLAIEQTIEDEATRRELSEAFARMADHMINREGP